MSALYNYFGATFTDVLHEFQGAPLTTFDSIADADGQAQIESAMDDAERVVLSHLPPDYRQFLDRIDYEIVEMFADKLAAALSSRGIETEHRSMRFLLTKSTSW